MMLVKFDNDWHARWWFAKLSNNLNSLSTLFQHSATIFFLDHHKPEQWLIDENVMENLLELFVEEIEIRAGMFDGQDTGVKKCP